MNCNLTILPLLDLEILKQSYHQLPVSLRKTFLLIFRISHLQSKVEIHIKIPPASALTNTPSYLGLSLGRWLAIFLVGAPVSFCLVTCFPIWLIHRHQRKKKEKKDPEVLVVPINNLTEQDVKSKLLRMRFQLFNFYNI